MDRGEQYCLPSKIRDDSQVAVLLSVIDANTYIVLCSLIAPTKPVDNSFDEIKEILKTHLYLTPVIVERFRFHTRNQSKIESIPEYVAELLRLVEHCQCGEKLSDAQATGLCLGCTMRAFRNGFHKG